MQLTLAIAKTQKQGDRLAAMTTIVNFVALEDLLSAAAEGVDLQTVRLDSSVYQFTHNRHLLLRRLVSIRLLVYWILLQERCQDQAHLVCVLAALRRGSERANMRVRLAYWEYDSGYSLKKG